MYDRSTAIASASAAGAMSRNLRGTVRVRDAVHPQEILCDHMATQHHTRLVRCSDPPKKQPIDHPLFQREALEIIDYESITTTAPAVGDWRLLASANKRERTQQCPPSACLLSCEVKGSLSKMRIGQHSTLS